MNKADAVILDCYVQSLEILFKGRKADLIPSRSLRSRVEQGNFMKPSDYYSEVISPWKAKPSTPMIIDLFCVHENLKQLVLFEKWIFLYNKDEYKESRPIQNRKVQTFVRSLFSFVRLLPGYQLLSYRDSRKPPTMYYDVYSADIHGVVPFSVPSIEYKFPVISGFNKTSLLVAVNYIRPESLQIVLNIPGSIQMFCPGKEKSLAASNQPQAINSNGGGDSERALSQESSRGALDFQPTHSYGLNQRSDHHASYSLDSANRRFPSNYVNTTDNKQSSRLFGIGVGEKQRSVSTDMTTQSAAAAALAAEFQSKSFAVAEDQLPPTGKGHARRLSCPGSPQNSSRRDIIHSGDLALSAGTNTTGFSSTRSAAQSYSPNIVTPAFLSDALRPLNASGIASHAEDVQLGSSPGISPPFASGPTFLQSTSPPTSAPSMSQLRDGLRRFTGEKSSWRGYPSPSQQGQINAGFSESSSGQDSEMMDELKYYHLQASPFEIMNRSAQVASSSSRVDAAEGNHESTITSSNAALVGLGPSSLSVLAQQFANPPASHVGTLLPVTESANIDDDNGSNDSDDSSDGDIEDMPFAWVPEAISGTSQEAVQDDVSNQRISNSMNIPMTNNLQQLCFAPPQLQSFRNPSDSSISRVEMAAHLTGTSISNKLNEFVKFRASISPRTIPNMQTQVAK